MLLLLAFLGGCAGLEGQVNKKAGHILSINRDETLPYERSVSDQIAWGGRFTEDELAADKLAAYSTKTLKLLMESLNNVSFYTRGAQPHISRQERVFDELARRADVKPDDVGDLFQRYLAARLFGKAQALKARFAEVKLWDLPDIIGAKDSPEQDFWVYDISSDSKTATAKHLPIETGPKIVVSAWYSCPVAAKAFQSVQDDWNMLQAMQAHGVILTSRFEPAGVALRNSKIAFARTYVAYTEQDWPGIDFTQSPTFHFLENGKVMYRFQGVAAEERFSQEFQLGLSAIGLK